MTFTFPEKLQLAQLPTPIQKMERLTARWGGPDLYIKRDDLTGMAVSGNKVRKLEFSAAKALREGCTVLITCGGGQSNHARATAATAAKLGLRCHLVLSGAPDQPQQGNLFLNRLLGAEITFLPEASLEDFNEVMCELAADYARQGEKALIIPLGASDATGSLGYAWAVKEMTGQFDAMQWTPDHIVVGCGSGGTLAGLLLGKELFGLTSQVWGINVRVDAAYFQQAVVDIFADLAREYGYQTRIQASDVHMIDGYVGAGYAISGPAEMAVIAEAAREEAILLDTAYTGKAFYGLSQEVYKGRFSKDASVLFLHTGGLFGMFPQAEEFDPKSFQAGDE
ncbi:MAG: D-cysteine desulfhydrase family protein [Anaerolineaceae bacterium]|jgi:D-cysteine desulfhydrase|nr:D-cysteine desulfhydrase family protein [Anaerolineaceae bacterium]